MPRLAVAAGAANGCAAALAQQLELPLIAADGDVPIDCVALLEFAGGVLRLRPCERRQSGPVAVDFAGGANRHRLRGGAELIAKAVRGRARGPLRVLDATAGLGRDAFVLAARGFEVTLLERSPVVAALLADGLARARAAEPAVAEIAARMTLHNADAVAWLAAAALPFDVICLDPMFPDGGGTALAKKEMRLFQQLQLDAGDEGALLRAARAVARLRVVVKRPLKAPALARQRPDYALEGRAVRFDVYTAAGLPTAGLP
jgi:16S rRNA (guanine1516-N2)-methyltransferase